MYTQARREANRRGRLARIERAKADPSIVPHGTVGGQANWGCHCPECVAAHGADQKARRQRRAAEKAAAESANVYVKSRPIVA